MTGVHFRLGTRATVTAVVAALAATFPAAASATQPDITLPATARSNDKVLPGKPSTHPHAAPDETEIVNPLEGISVVEVL